LTFSAFTRKRSHASLTKSRARAESAPVDGSLGALVSFRFWPSTAAVHHEVGEPLPYSSEASYASLKLQTAVQSCNAESKAR